jgi:hypothetical protein
VIAQQVHVTESIATPSGELVQIDRAMVPVVRGLWGWGVRTLQCCEDVGASILGGGWEYPQHRRVRYAAFWDGFAWLKMPIEDGARLVALTAEIAAGNGWECSSPVLPKGPIPVVNLYLPNRQLADVEELIRNAAG